MILAGDPKELEFAMRGLVKRRKRANPEAQIQRSLIQHINRRAVPGLLWWHVPNGGKRDLIEAANLKRLGVRKGVSDLNFLHQGRFYALELKSPGNPPTVEQMQFCSDVNTNHGFATITHGLDKAIKCLEVWGLLRGEAQ